MRKSVRKCLSLLAIVTLACSSNEIVDPGVVITTDPNTPGSVLITPPASPDLFVGQSISLVAAVKNTAGLVITVPVVWSTSDATIATVTSAGVLTGVKVGTVTVTGAAGGKSASIIINVRLVPVKSVTVTVKPSLLVGESSAAAAVSVDAQGNTLTGRAVAWSSRNAGVATVSTTGQVTAVAVGTTTIDAVVDGVIGSATVTVAPVPILIGSIAVSLAQSSATAQGQTTTASAVVTSTTGVVLTDRVLQWSSSNSDVATVSQLGIVTALASGTAAITASSEGKSGSATYTVTISLNNPVASITVSTASSTLSLGKTSQSTAVVRDALGSILANRVIAWSTSNAAVATVNASGLVQSTGLGTATITGSSEGKSATLTITVIPPPVTSVSVSAPATNLQPAATTQAVAVLKDVDGTVLNGRAIAWVSSTPATATVSASGLVTAIASGTTTITATSEGVSSSITITVPAVATVNVTAPSTNLQPTQTTQASAALLDAGATAVTNRVVTWSSSAPGVATVSTTGLVTAVASGSTTISATSEGKTGSITVTVPAVATIAVTASASFVLAGATSQLTATPKDASNNTLTNRVVTWSSGTPATATVSATGLVTAVATGTTTISATSEGKTGTLLFTVVPPIGSIAVSSSANSILLNGQSQATALILDTFGNPVTTIPPVWTSSSPTRASVTQAGVVTQVQSGSLANVTISASAGGVTASTVIQLIGHPAEVIPTLPQVFLNTVAPAAPDVGGAVISVASGDNLQLALDTAQPGDVVELAAGATFTGNFVLKNKGATSKWITIRPSNFAGLPAEGSRMTPTIAAALNLPRIETGNTANAIGFANGAHHYRFTGIDVGMKASVSTTFALINTESATGQGTLADVPNNLVFDRMFVHGFATQTVRRCFTLNSASTAVIDSYVSDCHELGSDSQAIAVWNGPGPFKIVNNYLEAAGENVIFGGTDPSIVNLVPSDVEIRRNHFFKQTSWKSPKQWLVKNLLELKNAQRVLIEGNVIQNSWSDGQNGLGVGFKSVNQSGGCSWCVTQDVTYQLNFLTNVGAGYNIAGAPDNNFPTIHARRIMLVNNVTSNINTGLFDGDGRLFLFSGDPKDVLIAHNTMLGATNAALVFGPAGTTTVNFMARDNLFGGGRYAVLGDNTQGGDAFALYAQGGFLMQTVFIGDPAISGTSNYGPPNLYQVQQFFEGSYTTATVGFANFAGGDYSLLSTSAYKNRGTDGTDIGANIAAVNAAIAGVIIP